jgi:paraquat-inducible protein A
MLDLFMISILAALVDMGSVSSVIPGPGATAFASVVVVTLFASLSFDPRLIWDLKEIGHGTE